MFVVTNYDRVRAAMLAFFDTVRGRFPGQGPASLDVVSPEQASGSNVDAAIVLGGHRRSMKEEQWHGGHQAQSRRRYVGCTRCAQRLASLG